MSSRESRQITSNRVQGIKEILGGWICAQQGTYLARAKQTLYQPSYGRLVALSSVLPCEYQNHFYNRSYFSCCKLFPMKLCMERVSKPQAG